MNRILRADVSRLAASPTVKGITEIPAPSCCRIFSMERTHPYFNAATTPKVEVNGNRLHISVIVDGKALDAALVQSGLVKSNYIEFERTPIEGQPFVHVRAFIPSMSKDGKITFDRFPANPIALNIFNGLTNGYEFNRPVILTDDQRRGISQVGIVLSLQSNSNQEVRMPPRPGLGEPI